MTDQLLSWDKPAPIRPKATLMDYSPEHPGDYIPNLSEADNLKWKAKLVGHKSADPRIEIRKRAGQAQLLLVVWQDGRVHGSANGTFEVTAYELSAVIAEAREFLDDRELT